MSNQTSYPQDHAAAFEGSLADNGLHDIRSALNGEASNGMPFGIAVAIGTTERTCKLGAASTAKWMGVVVRDASYSGAQYDANGIKPGAPVNVLSKGRINVQVEEDVAIGDRAFIRYADGTGGTQKGAFRKSANSTTAVEAKGMRYLSAALAGGIAVLEVDIPAGAAAA